MRALLMLGNEVWNVHDEHSVLLCIDSAKVAILALSVDELAEQNAGLAHDHVPRELLGVPPPMHPLAPCQAAEVGCIST